MKDGWHINGGSDFISPGSFDMSGGLFDIEDGGIHEGITNATTKINADTFLPQVGNVQEKNMKPTTRVGFFIIGGGLWVARRFCKSPDFTEFDSQYLHLRNIVDFDYPDPTD